MFRATDPPIILSQKRKRDNCMIRSTILGFIVIKIVALISGAITMMTTSYSAGMYQVNQSFEALTTLGLMLLFINVLIASIMRAAKGD
mgnify:CR=1 FL=1